MDANKFVYKWIKQWIFVECGFVDYRKKISTELSVFIHIMWKSSNIRYEEYVP